MVSVSILPKVRLLRSKERNLRKTVSISSNSCNPKRLAAAVRVVSPTVSIKRVLHSARARRKVRLSGSFISSFKSRILPLKANQMQNAERPNDELAVGMDTWAKAAGLVDGSQVSAFSRRSCGAEVGLRPSAAGPMLARKAVSPFGQRMANRPSNA
jgi:hypothetical protein